MLARMTGIQRLRYHKMINPDNPFRDLMLSEIISGNIFLAGVDNITQDAAKNLIDQILDC